MTRFAPLAVALVVGCGTQGTTAPAPSTGSVDGDGAGLPALVAKIH